MVERRFSAAFAAEAETAGFILSVVLDASLKAGSTATLKPV
jgi:hypothetical protein